MIDKALKKRFLLYTRAKKQDKRHFYTVLYQYDEHPLTSFGHL